MNQQNRQKEVLNNKFVKIYGHSQSSISPDDQKVSNGNGN